MSLKISNNILAPISLLLFIGTVIFLSVEMGRIDRLEDDLNREKVISEGLLSEKLLTEKERDKVSSALTHTQTSNARLKNRFDSANAVATAKQREINQLNAALQRTVHERSIYKNLQLKNSELEREKAKLEIENSGMELASVFQNEKISLLWEENQALQKKIELTPPAIRQALIETKKRNTKLTTVARRTRKLTYAIQATETENLTCEIITPAGTVIKTTDKTLSFISDSQNPKNIMITFTPDYKLEAGVYTLKILSHEKLAGSLQVRLR